MATLKEHQAAMVDLLANGSGIPASASRLAHAMHDVLSLLTTGSYVSGELHLTAYKKPDATTPGLNDKALAADVEACRPKATPAERRVKELENTVKQLRASNATMRVELAKLRVYAEHDAMPEQAGCRKPDTQVCARLSDHEFEIDTGRCVYCGKHHREVTL